MEVVAEGPRAAVDPLLEVLRAALARGRVDVVVEQYAAPRGRLEGFVER